jgi:hypothetical protein
MRGTDASGSLASVCRCSSTWLDDGVSGVDVTSDSVSDDKAQVQGSPGVLTWRTPHERNKLLRPWRLAVSIAFAEQPRCLRIAWVLDGLFNVKTGFCNASNSYLSKVTGLPVSKVQEALARLESDGAICRVTTLPTTGGQRWRAIYPATFLLANLREGVTPTVGATGNPHQLGVQILRRKKARLPKSALDQARLAAELRERSDSERAAAEVHHDNGGHLQPNIQPTTEPVSVPATERRH